MLGAEQETLKNGRKEIQNNCFLNSLNRPLESTEGGSRRKENGLKEKANHPSMVASKKCPVARAVGLSVVMKLMLIAH